MCHLAPGRRSDHEFVHVDIGRVKQPAALGGCQHGDGAGGPGGAEIGAFQGIDRNVHFERTLAADRRAHLLSHEEHRGFVPLALADDHPARDLHGAEVLTHGLDSDSIRLGAVTQTHGLSGRQGGLFGDTNECLLQNAVDRHQLPSRTDSDLGLVSSVVGGLKEAYSGDGCTDYQTVNIVSPLVGENRLDIEHVTNHRVIVDDAVGTEDLTRQPSAFSGHPDVVALGHRDMEVFELAGVSEAGEPGTSASDPW